MVKESYEIYEQLEEKSVIDYSVIICRNLKKFRLENYQKYQETHRNARRFENPYSADNISAFLDITPSYYRKLEKRENYISLNYLLKLAIIYDKNLDDFLKDEM